MNPKLKNLLTIVLPVIVIMLSGAVIWQKLTSRQTPSNPPDETVATVLYTDQGFEPATLRVNAGTTVVWINQSSQNLKLTPNANTDPAASASTVEGFGTPEPLTKGGKYSFTFTKPGQLNYRNDTNPTQNGSVNVVTK